ncbi:MAG: hypothetical protein M3083_12020 [Actinomycetota bacterium]|nr:hypothetical protein [Actinomycetota bacterium]
MILEGTARPAFQFPQVKELVRRLEPWRATGLFSLERYAVQLHSHATEHCDALSLALAAHDQAIRAMEVRTPKLLRAEVLTLAELKLGCAQTMAESQPGRSFDALIPTQVYEATRSLLRANTRAQIDEVLTAFVITAGGTVNLGELSYTPGQISVDLGLSPADRVYATADAASMAGLMIEQSLPTLIHDAERMLARLHMAEQPHL